jgi:hypothetical protein
VEQRGGRRHPGLVWQGAGHRPGELSNLAPRPGRRDGVQTYADDIGAMRAHCASSDYRWSGRVMICGFRGEISQRAGGAPLTACSFRKLR